MKLMSFHLTEKQRVALKKMSEDSGLSMADIIRRILDDYISKSGGKYEN